MQIDFHGDSKSSSVDREDKPGRKDSVSIG